MSIFDLGPHATFIWLSYIAVVIVITGLISWLIFDGQRQRAALKDLEDRGVRRRSSVSSDTGQNQ